ncbi:hypothetical protein [Neosynechococcus sphagnicola]|uniref:hypothetical protein n=1 Tax=Neosynechococcus sphagnicola TaxID=1501145 RepID=UPI00056C2382|nr:hypothetical protein [Neosynechococcus sphagnicola]
MSEIFILVKNALKSGYLTIEAEQRLHQLTLGQCSLFEIDSLLKLQQAFLTNLVKKETYERKRSQLLTQTVPVISFIQ